MSIQKVMEGKYHTAARATGGAGFDLAQPSQDRIAGPQKEFGIYKRMDLSKVKSELFIPSVLDATKINSSVDGKVYGLPHIWGTDGLVVNTSMTNSLPRPAWLYTNTVSYSLAFFAFLFLPLAIVAAFAFNDAPYPAPPWRGFTLDWFLGSVKTARRGLIADTALLGSLWTSVVVASWVTVLAVLMRTANLADDLWGIELDFLSPGLTLVVLGQLSFIVSVATLTITARLKRFDTTLEEAAYNLGASRAAVFGTITLPYLKPSLIGAAAISFLMSFENFNTTLMRRPRDPASS